jgi:hypothetical protein
MSNKFGTRTPRAGSGTEEEFKLALDSKKATGRPDIFFYFKEAKISINAQAIAQTSKVLKFKNYVQSSGCLTGSYRTSDHFRDQFRVQLSLWLNRLYEDADRPKLSWDAQAFGALGVGSLGSVSRFCEYVAAAVAAEKMIVARAQLVQHSSEVSTNLLHTLMKAGTDIELFLQEPEQAQTLLSALFSRRIQFRIQDYLLRIKRSAPAGDFILRTYSVPASVNLSLLEFENGRKMISVGWYVYYEKQPDQAHGGRTLGGGERPCVIVTSENKSFAYFHDFAQDLLQSLATSPAPLRHAGTRGKPPSAIGGVT